MTRANVILVKVLGLLIFFGVAAIWLVHSGVKEIGERDSLAKDYYDHLSVNFSGVVTGVKEVDPGSGVIYMRKIKSSASRYDGRDFFDFTCCIINESRIDMIGALRLIEIGDSVIFDSSEDIVYYFRGDSLVERDKMYFYPPPWFARYEAAFRE